MNIKWKEIVVTIMAGSFVTSLGVYLIGYTAAFAMPRSLSPYILVWEIVVIQFLGIGLIALAVAFFLSKIMRFNPNIVVALLLTSVVFFTSLYEGTYHVYWPHIFVLIACLLAGSRLPMKNA